MGIKSTFHNTLESNKGYRMLVTGVPASEFVSVYRNKTTQYGNFPTSDSFENLKSNHHHMELEK